MLEHPVTVGLCIIRQTRAHLGCAVLPQGVDHAGELMRRGGDRLRRPQPGFPPAAEGSQGTWPALPAPGGQPQRRRHPVGTWRRAARSPLASGDPVVRTAPKPGGALRHGRPPPQVQPALADARHRRGLVTALHGGPVAPRHPMACAAHVEARAMACPLARAHQRPHGFMGLALGARPQRRVALAVTRGALLVLRVREGHGLG